jgi:hypothetical protein
VTYLKDQLGAVRVRLNELRRIERKIVKDIRRMCSHTNIKKIVKKERLLPHTFYLNSNDVSNTITVGYKVVCQDCGKVLSNWKG